MITDRIYYLFFSTVIVAAILIVSPAATAVIEKDTNPAEEQQEKDNEDEKKDPTPEEIEKARQKEELEREKTRADNIERILKFGLHSERRDIIRRVLSIKDDTVQERLARTLTDLIKKDDDTEVLKNSITVLGELNFNDAAGPIASHLSNSNEDIRIAAVYALAAIDDDAYVPDLLEKLKEQDLTVDSNFTEALIITLGNFKAEDIYEIAEKAIKDPKATRNAKEQFVLALGKIESEKPKELLLEIFTDDQETITLRSYAVNSLAHLGIEEAIPEIHKLMEEIDSYDFRKRSRYNTLQVYAIAALARLGDKDIIPRLHDALKSDNTSMRLRAINLIKDMDDETSIDILKYRMEHDPEARVRKAARDALKEMDVKLDDEEEVELHEDALDYSTDDPEDEQPGDI